MIMELCALHPCALNLQLLCEKLSLLEVLLYGTEINT